MGVTSISFLDVDGENLAWLAASSTPPPPNGTAPLTSSTSLFLLFSPTSSFSLSLPFSLSERVISRNLVEELPDTSERRYPPKAQHGYNRNLHQIHRRVSAVRRARKMLGSVEPLAQELRACSIACVLERSAAASQPLYYQASGMLLR
ncbi:hypothetical protein E1301_Tti001526 [Triplophysa tibetana]|uniref:Uncharacterized protein n=1 Tax=Triplophysa tibetana TaxID=1572043 RepID=A0A5A9P7F3_9TELE|nr:hypothetical protein E1301_Tti001526 [Triplophysa tibetana]